MASETQTPNIGLQIPAYNQPNWQVPTNYNWNLLDLIFGGSVQVPGLNVLNLTVSASNFAALLAASLVQEIPSGAIPGTAYNLSHTPTFIIALCVNGLVQRLTTDYTVSGNVVTLNYSTSAGDTVYAIYLQ